MNLSRSQNRCFLAIVVSVAGLTMNPVARAADAPAVFQNPFEVAPKYDVLPSARRKVSPVYPYELLMAGKSGWADASFVIDYLGRPLFAAPKAASDPAFAKAIVAMVEASDYVPGRRGKHAVMSPQTEHFQFLGEESMDSEARRVLSELRNGGSNFTMASQLDERPRAVRQESPVYPRALKDDGLTGEAEIEFVVDRDGRVLFPRIISATHEDFGWAAATAVSQWHYQPPTSNGKHVDTIMRVPVLFDAHKLAAAD
jgi:TonB family protein